LATLRPRRRLTANRARFIAAEIEANGTNYFVPGCLGDHDGRRKP